MFKTKSRADELRATMKSNMDEARAVVAGAKAAGRLHLTTTEAAKAEAALNAHDAARAELEKMHEADEVMRRMGAKSAPALGAGGAGARWAEEVTRSLAEKAGSYGVKALLTGEVTTPSAVEVADLPELPTRLLDLVPRQELDEHTFSYLRQTVRTNNAASVADGATKPTSVFTFEEVEDRARVVAHLSEPFPLRFMDDHNSMIEVLQAQLVGGIWEALEALVVAGNEDAASGDQWDGILATPGTTYVEFSSDVVTTLRKSRTTLEGKGERVTAVVMNPADVEDLDLLRTDSGAGGFLMDGSAYERLFGPGVQGIPSASVPKGLAVVGDWTQTRLRTRQNAHTLAATQAGDLFDKNQVKLRTEGRYGFQFMRPQALALVGLKAASAHVTNTAYATGAVVTRSAGTLLATIGGTSDNATAPTLPAKVGDTVTDGTVTWRRIA